VPYRVEKINMRWYEDDHSHHHSCPLGQLTGHSYSQGSCLSGLLRVKRTIAGTWLSVVLARCGSYGPKKKDFLRLTRGAGMLPVVEIDGRVITESSVIMQELEDTFPDYTPLLAPRGSPARKTTDAQMAMERDLFGSWLRWLRADESPRARKGFEHAMDKTDALLASNGGGPYFGGAEVSLADCIFASSLERISASILYYKGVQVKGAGRWAHVDSWFAAMESRPAYRYEHRHYLW
jgi:glutathione S-transferase